MGPSMIVDGDELVRGCGGRFDRASMGPSMIIDGDGLPGRRGSRYGHRVQGARALVPVQDA
jgi:hypothetical protein